MPGSYRLLTECLFYPPATAIAAHRSGTVESRECIKACS